MREHQNSAYRCARSRGNIRTLLENVQKTGGMSEQCLKYYRRQREYQNCAHKATGGRDNIRTGLSKLQETVGIP
jgi:hypothetical protein